MTKRDEQGRFVSQEEEMTQEQREAICYKSKLLNRYFDSYEELTKAETAFKQEQAAKTMALETKRTDAKKVEEAYKHAIQVKKEAEEQIRKAEDEYFKLRNEFCSKYGSFHMTFTNADAEPRVDTNVANPFMDLINYIFNY